MHISVPKYLSTCTCVHPPTHTHTHMNTWKRKGGNDTGSISTEDPYLVLKSRVNPRIPEAAAGGLCNCETSLGYKVRRCL